MFIDFFYLRLCHVVPRMSFQSRLYEKAVCIHQCCEKKGVFGGNNPRLVDFLVLTARYQKCAWKKRNVSHVTSSGKSLRFNSSLFLQSINRFSINMEAIYRDSHSHRPATFVQTDVEVQSVHLLQILTLADSFFTLKNSSISPPFFFMIPFLSISKVSGCH